MRYAFHPEALAEFEAAADFYSERQVGLEVRFIDAVQNAIRRICDSPERWSVFNGEIRRILVHVFLTRFFMPQSRIASISSPSCIAVASRDIGRLELNSTYYGKSK